MERFSVGTQQGRRRFCLDNHPTELYLQRQLSALWSGFPLLQESRDEVGLGAIVSPSGSRFLLPGEKLDDTLSTRAGTFMKQGAWYDIIRAIDKYDALWHCRRFDMQEVARFL